MPKRIQRSRAKGSRLPEGAVCVSRGTRWGNRYCVERAGRDWWFVLIRDSTFSRGPFGTRAEAHAEAVHLYRADLSPEQVAAARRDLRGKDLACWCPLDLPCHADALLEIANEGTPP